MSYNYGTLQSMSDRLIRKFGRELTFERFQSGDYTPSKSQTSNNVITTYKAFCVQSNWTATEKQQNDILETDIKLVATVADYKKNDNVSIDGGIYKIYDFEKIQPSSDGLLYILQVRK